MDYRERLTNNANDFDGIVMDMITEIISLREEVTRLSEREGKASVYICFDDGENPFHQEEAKIVDFGVADNVYIVESDEVNSLRAQLKEKDEALQELQTKLAEAEKATKHPNWEYIWKLLNAFASGDTQKAFARVEPMAVLAEVYSSLAQIDFARKAAIAKGEE